jgi:hypothetical protein
MLLNRFVHNTTIPGIREGEVGVKVFLFTVGVLVSRTAVSGGKPGIS